MAAQIRAQQEEVKTIGKEDCGCGCGGAACGTARHDCGCGCGGSACGAVMQEMVFVGSLADRHMDKPASEVCYCDGSCGCGGYS